MTRGPDFIALDMPEAGVVAMLLRDDLRYLELRLMRGNVPEGLPEAVASARQLLDRLRSALVSAGVELPQ